MLNQFIIFLIFISTFCHVFSADVNVNVDIYADYSSFTYEFIFENDESYRTFSFEKPKDSIIDSITSNNFEDDIKYSVAGDYFIINPDNVKNTTFLVRLTSSVISDIIFEKNSFEVYSNFNFLVDKLTFNINLMQDVGEIESFFPRDYRLLEDGSFQWNLFDISREELFRLEFSKLNSKEDIKNETFWTDNLIIVVSGVILLSALLTLVLMFLFSSKSRLFNIDISLNKKSKMAEVGKIVTEINVKSEKAPIINTILTEVINEDEIVRYNDDESIDNKKNDDIDVVDFEKDSNSKINKEEYKEVMDKFLTENEKLIVSCVYENEGISQYDILNFLPSLTKSNLSKIISKLDNKKILKRIRVGKVNKIYLGSRFDLQKENSKEE